MPWKRAKALPPPDNSLFEACFRIQQEACEAAGRFIPLVVENVRGAQKWVGRSRWHYGSFHLWGDVPALMPIVRRHAKVSGFSMNQGAPKWNMHHMDCAMKGVGIGSVSWAQGKGQRHPNDPRNFYSKSSARKAASAHIAKIPLPLARHIARAWHPEAL